MGFEGKLPSALSPSRLADFQSCPRKFQHGVIDRIPQPATYATAKGNVLHEVLEHLFERPAPQRTRDAAGGLLPDAETAVLAPTVREEAGIDDATLERLRRELNDLLDRYFEMEDPATVDTVGVELRVREELNGAPVLGILDRLDRHQDGSTTIVDYKTGKVPRRDYDAQTFANTELYAALCEAHYGQRPTSIRLLYLSEGATLERPVTEPAIAARRVAAARAWDRITDYYRAGEFPATPSTSACRFCAFRDRCRAAGVAVPV